MRLSGVNRVSIVSSVGIVQYCNSIQRRSTKSVGNPNYIVSVDTPKVVMN